MPSNVSYQRKYYSVLYEELGTIPYKEGNVIATYDTNGFYYDVGNPAGSGQNVVRRQASGIEFVESLTSEAVRPGEPTTIYVIDNGVVQDEDGNNIHSYSGYVWNTDDDDYREIFNNCHDFQVKSVASDSTKAYLVASSSEITGTGTLFKNPNIYLTTTGNKIHAGLEGNADSATRASTAAQADRATIAEKDINSVPIVSYITNVQSDITTQNPGTKLTITKGDGTTSDIYTQDTVYNVYSENSSGLVSGWGTSQAATAGEAILLGSGWTKMSDVSLPAADKATYDSSGTKRIDSYVASLSYSAANEELTVTDGAGNSSTVSIPDTQYPTFDVGINGLVIGPDSTETNKFLRGDNTWQDVITADYQGATSSAAGVHGLVPAASAGEENAYLKGDGTWGGVFVQDSSGLVPAPTSADISADKVLQADGTWVNPPDTTDTAGSSNDTSSQLYVLGALTQSATGNTTYSNQYVYVLNSRLYQSDGGSTPTAIPVVDISSSQALTNKTYEGYQLGSACAESVATIVSASNPDDLPNNNAVINYITSTLPGQISTAVSGKGDKSMIAPIYDSTHTYVENDWCIFTDVDGDKLWRCTAQSTTGAFDSDDWQSYTVIDAIKYLIANP